MVRNAGAVLIVGGLSLAGAAALTASLATSLPRAAAPSTVAPVQATKPLPTDPLPARREENGEDGGSLGGRRKADPLSAPSAAADPVAPPASDYPRGNREIRIEAPDTNVRVNADSGRVRVDAPYAFVDVNPERGRAVIRAPGFNLDLRW